METSLFVDFFSLKLVTFSTQLRISISLSSFFKFSSLLLHSLLSPLTTCIFLPPAANDYSVETTGLFGKLFFFASFNDHVTHHLFPTIDLSQQHRVRRLFLETCAEHHVEYNGEKFVDLAKGTARVLTRKPGDLAFKRSK